MDFSRTCVLAVKFGDLSTFFPSNGDNKVTLSVFRYYSSRKTFSGEEIVSFWHQHKLAKLQREREFSRLLSRLHHEKFSNKGKSFATKFITENLPLHLPISLSTYNRRNRLMHQMATF